VITHGEWSRLPSAAETNRKAADMTGGYKRGVDLISDVLPYGALWYAEPNAISNAINYAKFRSRSHDTVIRVYDESGHVIPFMCSSVRMLPRRQLYLTT